MRVPRLYVDVALAAGSSVTLDEAARHHLQHVLRAKNGQEVCLFNGTDTECRGRLTELDRRCAVVALESRVETSREPALAITLVQGLSRGERMDFTLQKAVELGVSTLVPVITEHTVIRLDPAQAERRHAHWQQIVIHACEQCGRNRLPALLPASRLGEWLSRPIAGTGVVLRPDAELPIARLPAPATGGITIVIGPEGGLSGTEIALAESRGYRSVRLGSRILRTETAALAALAAIHALWGDYR